MKKYDDLTARLLERRDRYVAEQKKRNKVLMSGAATLCVVALVGVAAWQGVDAPTPPPVVPSDAVITTTAVPTEGEDTTTTTTTAVNTTITTIDTTISVVVTPTTTVASATTPVPSQTTTAPIKTEATQTTTTAGAKDKTLIMADTLDDYFDRFGGVMDESSSTNSNTNCISPTLKEKMKEYRYADVVYAVTVEIPLTQADRASFWESTEEIAQTRREHKEVYEAFLEEAKQLNSYWDGTDVSYIETWTDTMRANYERWLILDEEMTRLENMDKTSFYESVMEKRFEMLKATCVDEPIPVSFKPISNERLWYYSYYAELTYDQINTLAKQGGYRFSLAIPLDVLLELWGWIM